MSDLKRGWIKYNAGAKLRKDKYYCAYGNGPYVGMFSFDADEKCFYPAVNGVQIVEWKKAAESPLVRVQEYYNEDYSTWHDAAVSMPTEAGKYICRFVHNYNTGLFEFDDERENPWGDNIIVTHYMELD